MKSPERRGGNSVTLAIRMSVRCTNSPWVTPGTGQLSPGQG